MSQRPPATWIERYHSTAANDTTGGATAWPQLSGSPTTLSTQRSGGLFLQSIEFEAAGNFVATPSSAPNGATPATVTQPIPGPKSVDYAPQSIDPSTTALPFTLYYGPLGVGAR
jgi:hypothetical protein